MRSQSFCLALDAFPLKYQYNTYINWTNEKAGLCICQGQSTEVRVEEYREYTKLKKSQEEAFIL